MTGESGNEYSVDMRPEFRASVRVCIHGLFLDLQFAFQYLVRFLLSSIVCTQSIRDSIGLYPGPEVGYHCKCLLPVTLRCSFGPSREHLQYLYTQ